MNIWIDNIRPMPEGYNIHCHTTDEALAYISGNWEAIKRISLTYYAGDYRRYGGDYIKILQTLEEWTKNDHSRQIHWTFNFHNMGPVEAIAAQELADKNEWDTI